MDNELLEKWINESKERLEKAKQLYEEKSTNKVYPTIGKTGSINAFVFSDKGIVSVTPCYDEYHAGKFGTGLAYPEEEKIVAAYAQKTGVDASQVQLTDDAFISFTLDLFGKEDNGWEITHANWINSYSGYSDILYDSMQDAVNSIYTDDVYCESPYLKKTSSSVR